MATANQQTISDKTEEEVKLEEELRTIAQDKDEAFEMSREADERLRKSREEERQKKERLHQIRLERAERDQKKTATNTSERVELQQLRRLNSDQKASLEKVQANLQSITSSSARQQKEKRAKEEEIEKQTRRIKCLEDEISAAKQLSAETQLRQLNELQSLTQETAELKETVTELRRQQQEPANEERHQGNYISPVNGVKLYGIYCFFLLLCVCLCVCAHRFMGPNIPRTAKHTDTFSMDYQ